MKIGPRQRRLLAQLARPGSALIVGDDVSRSLVRRGLLEEDTPGSDSILTITPAGLRVLADEAEAGRVDLKIKPRGRK